MNAEIGKWCFDRDEMWETAPKRWHSGLRALLIGGLAMASWVGIGFILF